MPETKILIISLRKPKEMMQKLCRTAGLISRKSADLKLDFTRKQKESKK